LALGASRRAEAAGGRIRLAVVASTVDELAELLRTALAGDDAPGVYRAGPAEPGEVAVLFPGQGSQRPGMFAELFVTFPELQRYLRLDPPTAGVVFGPAVFGEPARQAQAGRVTDTRVAQPALGLTGLAAFRLLTRAGVRPAMLGGHSYGELTALAAAGALTPEALLHASHARAGAMAGAVPSDDPGAMAAVSAGAAETGKVLADAGLATVVLANHNSPQQTVISGPTADVETAVGHLRAAGLGAKRLQVACAFHSSLVAPAGEAFGRALEAIGVVRPAVPVYANRTAGPYPPDPDAIRGELAAQLGAPVRFVEQVEAMYAAGARVFVEAGPGAVLAKQVAAILGDRPHRTVGFEQPGRRGLPGFLGALAQLAVSGVDVGTGWLFRGRDAVDASAAERPTRPGWTVDGHLLRAADGTIPAGALRPAERITLGVSPGPEPVSSEAMVADFLRTSREMIAAQRDVLLGFFGADAPAPVRAAIPAPQVVVAPAPPEVTVGRSVLATVVEVIGERTGYPVEMIEPDLDLEADLSVDSIKRAEIAGELAARLGLAGGDVEEFAKARTAAAIVELIGGAEPAAAVVPVLATVVEVIGERTGYPAEMIEPDLDLEADLSIDSIKRAEIAGELTVRLGTGDVEELAKARTAAGIAELLGNGEPGSGEPRPVPGEPEPVIVAPKRYLMTEVALAPAGVPTIAGRRFLVVGSGAGDVRAALETHGAEAETGAEVRPGFDGYLFLDPVLPAAFRRYQDALGSHPRWLLSAGPAEGLRGFHRSLAREYPDTLVRVVEGADAAALVAELSTADREPVVVHRGGVRHGIEPAEEDLGPLARSGAGPAGDG
ncbi:acyltransferase domain-containing protein, partial [Amycolatopsis vancoresmycina]